MKKTRDYADHSRTKEMTLPGAELLRRFLLHVVPGGFMRIRHYGSPPTATGERGSRAVDTSSGKHNPNSAPSPTL